MTGTLTGLSGNRILLTSRSKTFTPCSPLTFLSLFIAITMDGDLFALPNASDQDPAGVVTWTRTPGTLLSTRNFSRYCFAASLVADERPTADVAPVAVASALPLLSGLE